VLNLLRTATFYFAIVFGTGFLLGALRVWLVVPAIGTRAAELLEMPLMLAVVAAAARYVTWRFSNTIHSKAGWLQVGAIAFACVLCADVIVGIALRGMTVGQALFERDPLSGAAYYLALGWLAAAPWFFVRHR
jgi:hypothetical protein